MGKPYAGAKKWEKKKDGETLLCVNSANTPPTNKLCFLLRSSHMVLTPVLLKNLNPNKSFKVLSATKNVHVVLHTLHLKQRPQPSYILSKLQIRNILHINKNIKKCAVC